MPVATQPSGKWTGRLRWARGARGWLSRTWQRMQPAPATRRGVAWGVAGAAALAVALVGAQIHPASGAWWDLPVGVLVALGFVALVGLGVVVGLRLLALVPRFLGWLGLAAAPAFVLVAVLAFGLPGKLGVALGLAIVAVEGALGGALAALLAARRGAPVRPAKRAALAVVVLAAVAAHVGGAWWLADRGSIEHLVKVRRPDPVRVAPLAAPDPSQPGPHRVASLTYGSGTDRWRPEFGREVDLKVSAVDATPFVKGNEGWTIKVRDWYWGFGFDAFPRNGRVWYPEGAGPFPLVLVVHGNHNMAEFSDPGYEYLGRLLASRGFITVSVDENFLNGHLVGGLERENDARGWMLLKHLELWRDWNRTPGHRFQRKVDLERIALIGHSRGGEAVGIAAAFNRLPRYPDDATVPLGFGFGIRSVVAIAPVDGQYKPAGKPTPVADVSYLLLQGGHDGDVSVFLGERLYRRLAFTDGRYRFKTYVWSYRANHGQFNTVWGDGDVGWPRSLILNREALLDAAAQRRLGAVYISGFLEATLHDAPAYVRLFRDGRSARAWLPDDLYVTGFADSTFRPAADFEEDVDVTTASVAGAAIDGRYLALWKERDLPLREGEGTKQNQVVYLGWERDPAAPRKIASYTVRLPDDLPAGWSLGPETALVVSLTDSGEEPPDPPDPKTERKAGAGEPSAAEQEAAEAKEEREEKEAEERKERDAKEGKQPLDLTIELVALDGTIARLPLSAFRALPVPLDSDFTKLADEAELYGDAWEPVLQTFELPLAAFAEARPGFDPAAVRAVRFVFDRSPEGVVILDDLGFADLTGAPGT